MAKPKPKPDDKKQSKSFVEKAREIEADESEKAFEGAVQKIIPPSHHNEQGLPKKDQRQELRRRSS